MVPLPRSHYSDPVTTHHPRFPKPTPFTMPPEIPKTIDPRIIHLRFANELYGDTEESYRQALNSNLLNNGIDLQYNFLTTPQLAEQIYLQPTPQSAQQIYLQHDFLTMPQ
ncbi:hypothetical protein BC936DRAFT_143601 [Jimgerdemannia flammicorona]|uniref:Uncharacterized protein n=1 Tax=Jimgerdemannia flammicorona TaxID=994334 RepID=A0A433DDL1_9FUNG|nr:hypothetical protein BC936DRAFT_143601 [Jimgerdemannia flammicorona]